MQNYERADFFRGAYSTPSSGRWFVWAFLLALMLGEVSAWAQPTSSKDKAKDKKNQPGKINPADDLNVIDAETLPPNFQPPSTPISIMDLEKPIATKEELAKLKSSFHSQFHKVKSDCDLSESGRKVIVNSIRYRLGSLAAITPAQMKENPKLLPDFLRQFLTELSNDGNPGSSPAAVANTKAYVNQEVVKQIPELLTNNFYIRLYSVFILSEMDYAPAYELLLQVIQAKDFREDEENGQPEPIKIAAINGLIRILRFANPTVKDRTIIANAVVDELKKKDAFWWIQCQQIEALRHCDINGINAGDNNKPFVVDCLMAIVKDTERHPRVRSKACYALGRVPIPAAVKIENVVTAIVECALQISTAATASPKDPNWGWCLLDLYLAFHPGNRPKEADKDAGKSRDGGLLVSNKAAAQGAYELIFPLLNDVRAGKGPDASNLKKLSDFVKTRKPVE